MPFQAYQTCWKQTVHERVEAHLPLVYSLASTLHKRVSTAGLEIGDLIHVGVLALYRASDAYDEKRGTSFGTFSKPFVRGAMLDEIAKLNNQSRSIRDKRKRIRKAEDKLSSKLMRRPSEVEVASECGIAINTLFRWKLEIDISVPKGVDVRMSRRASYVEDLEISRRPELRLLKDELHSQLVSAFSTLKPWEQQLLHLYYQEQLTFREIGYVLDLSESQISRKHKALLNKLRNILL